MDSYQQEYAHVPKIDSKFPQNVTLGEVSYPSDIFSDSIGYDRIRKVFGEKSGDNIVSLEHIELPLSFDLRNSFNVLLNAPESNSSAIRVFTHHVMWSMLSFLPVTKVNFLYYR